MAVFGLGAFWDAAGLRSFSIINARLWLSGLFFGGLMPFCHDSRRIFPRFSLCVMAPCADHETNTERVLL